MKRTINPITGRLINDFTDYKFNKLLVIGLDIDMMQKQYSKGKRGSYWKCKCDCGNEDFTTVCQTDINRTISCGCTRKAIYSKDRLYENLIGNKYGLLKVESLNEEKTYKNRLRGKRIRFWNCKCDCGQYSVVNGESLKGGKTLSCGCVRDENIKNAFIKRAKNGNSIGHYIEDKYKTKDISTVWDFNKNDIDPYGLNRGSIKYVYIKCENDFTHPSYKVQALCFTGIESRCPICNASKGEKVIERFLTNQNIPYLYQKSFDNLLGIGGGLLSYDFYINYNNSSRFLLEYQGQYHDGNGNYYIKQNFKKQQEHDRRKHQYAKDHNIELLEIWYWDFDNIEQILKEKLQISN